MTVMFSAQAEERQDEHDHNDQANNIDHAIHDASPQAVMPARCASLRARCCKNRRRRRKFLCLEMMRAITRCADARQDETSE
jgi:hypothetical protein